MSISRSIKAMNVRVAYITTFRGNKSSVTKLCVLELLTDIKHSNGEATFNVIALIDIHALINAHPSLSKANSAYVLSLKCLRRCT